MHEMLGLDPETSALTAETLAELVHPEDRQHFQSALEGPETTGGRSEKHLRIRRADNSYGNFLFRGLSVRDASGGPVRVVGSIADLTPLLQTERKLAEQTDLLNLAHDAIIVRDMTGRVNTGTTAPKSFTAGPRMKRAAGRTATSSRTPAPRRSATRSKRSSRPARGRVNANTSREPARASPFAAVGVSCATRKANRNPRSSSTPTSPSRNESSASSSARNASKVSARSPAASHTT